ncbi:MAG: hypothetical protein Q9195_009188 [Heterodermia aff. obscurata]
MDFEKGIQEIKDYVAVWENIKGRDKFNVKSLINHKIDLLGSCTQDPNTTLVDDMVQVVKLRGYLDSKKFHLVSAEALISKLVQDSMCENGLESLQEPPVEEPALELLRQWDPSFLYKVARVNYDNHGDMTPITKVEDKNYLVLHSHKPLRCDLVRQQDLDEPPVCKQDLVESSSWSGFFIDAVDTVKCKKKDHTKMRVELSLDGVKERKKLLLVFWNEEEAKCWYSDFKVQTEGNYYNHED